MADYQSQNSTFSTHMGHLGGEVLSRYYLGQLEPLDEKVSGSNLSKNIFKKGVEYVCTYIYSNIHQLLKGFLIVPHMWHVADSDKFYDNFTQTCFSSHLRLRG